jgi:entericidin A
MKKLSLVLLSLLLLNACNTIQGVGRDVKKVGEVVEGAGKK